jgi:hypothetical protein
VKALSEQNHYEVLELAPGASVEAVTQAYAKVKASYAPGALVTYALTDPGEAEALTRRIEEAYSVLADPEKRRAYDVAGGFPAPEAGSSAQAPSGSTSLPAPVSPPAQDAAPVVSASGGGSAQAVAVAPAPPPPALEVAHVPAPPPPAAPPQAVAVAPSPSPAAPVHEVAVAPAPLQPPAPIASSEPLTLPPVVPVGTEPGATAPSAPSPSSEKPVRKTESELAPEGPVTGDALRRVREAHGLSLKELEGRTKIGHWHLDNIEREKFSALPAQVYLRGFLMSLARELKLDPVRVSKSYLEQMKAKQTPKPE